ncbi:MAG: Phosphopantetheine-binding protein [Rhizobacter sp.]|nr:Phosphopantetheine-binding protein [Rhizobacter sp.]
MDIIASATAHAATIGQLKDLIQSEFEIDASTIDIEAPFAAYNLDSLTLAELMFAIEDKLHVAMPDSLGMPANLVELAVMIDGERAAASAGAAAPSSLVKAA